MDHFEREFLNEYSIILATPLRKENIQEKPVFLSVWVC